MAAPMDLFPDGMHVWLRSRVRGMYLCTDEDGFGVSLSSRRASVHAAWLVHRLPTHDDGAGHFLLCSSAYGRYLALSPDPAPPGLRGRRAVQRTYDDQQDQDAIRWTAVDAGGGNGDVLLRHGQNLNLRANGRYCSWHTGVTVDDDGGGHPSTMMHWTVVHIPQRPAPPALPPPAAGGLFRRLTGIVPPRLRAIRYPERRTGEAVWVTFNFTGRSVYNLRAEMQFRVHQPNITLFIQAGFYGRLIPLVVDLPRRVQLVDIAALPTSSAAVAATRHPDVDALVP